MKRLNPSPADHITIDNTIELDDNFVVGLNELINTLIAYKKTKYNFKNNSQNDKSGLSVIITIDPETKKQEFQQIVDVIKKKYPNISYNQQNNLISYTKQQQGATTTTTNTNTNTDIQSDLRQSLYGGVAQKIMSRAMGVNESQEIFEEINRIKELLK